MRKKLKDGNYCSMAKSLTGWHGYLGKGYGGWKVDNGVLVLDSIVDKSGNSIGVDIVSDAEYENFHFENRLEDK